MLLGSCAQIVTPSGGLKDVVPPKVIAYSPDSASINFRGKFIKIDFDEYFTLSDLNKQLIISPPLENMPDIKMKGKSLLITINEKENLSPNTTYAINFGNAIRDLNENNIKENFKYIFSTGSFIDSLSVEGNVMNAFDNKVEKGVFVLLYNNFEDSIVYNNLPNYFTKTKEDGSFKIDNIKEGVFKIVALKDENANYKYDGESEKIGFVTDTINSLSDKPIQLKLFNEIPSKIFIKKRMYNSYGQLLFVFNASADSVGFQPLNHVFGKDNVLLDYSLEKDSVTYWFRNIEKDSLILQIKNGNTVLNMGTATGILRSMPLPYREL